MFQSLFNKINMYILKMGVAVMMFIQNKFLVQVKMQIK
jgi:hypothetical protein